MLHKNNAKLRMANLKLLASTGWAFYALVLEAIVAIVMLILAIACLGRRLEWFGVTDRSGTGLGAGEDWAWTVATIIATLGFITAAVAAILSYLAAQKTASMSYDEAVVA